MDKKEEFKGFVKENPRLIQFVKNGDMTWQKFYEMYDIYGKEHTVWDEYLKTRTAEKVATGASAAAGAAGAVGIADILNFVKQIDLDSIQNSVSSVQRVLGVLQDFGGNTKETKKETYKPRPIYKHFED